MLSLPVLNPHWHVYVYCYNYLMSLSSSYSRQHQLRIPTAQGAGPRSRRVSWNSLRELFILCIHFIIRCRRLNSRGALVCSHWSASRESRRGDGGGNCRGPAPSEGELHDPNDRAENAADGDERDLVLLEDGVQQILEPARDRVSFGACAFEKRSLCAEFRVGERERESAKRHRGGPLFLSQIASRCEFGRNPRGCELLARRELFEALAEGRPERERLGDVGLSPHQTVRGLNEFRVHFDREWLSAVSGIGTIDRTRARGLSGSLFTPLSIVTK